MTKSVLSVLCVVVGLACAAPALAEEAGVESYGRMSSDTPNSGQYSVRTLQRNEDRDGVRQSRANPASDPAQHEGYLIDCPLPTRDILASGRLQPRECTLANLRLAGRSHNYEWVRQSTETLNGFYERRSDRQQRFLDVGAAVTWTGAVGAGFAGRVGVPTQRAWLGLAFVPVLLSQQNAHEPTRDLYYAGSIGLQMIATRYATIVEMAHRIKEAPGGASVAEISCRRVERAVGRIAAWAQGDDRAALLPEAQRLANSCYDLQVAQNQYDQTQTLITDDSFNGSLASAYALDIYALDQTLLARDRRFRYSPSETIGLMIAAPLRSLDSLLSGQNPDDALKKLQTAEAFDALDQTLADVVLPTQPRVAGEIAALNEDARARAFITTRPDGQPSATDVNQALTDLRAAVATMRRSQYQNASRGQYLTRLYTAANARQLSFHFAASTGAITVRLGPLGSNAAPAPEQAPATPAESGGEQTP